VWVRGVPLPTTPFPNGGEVWEGGHAPSPEKILLNFQAKMQGFVCIVIAKTIGLVVQKPRPAECLIDLSRGWRCKTHRSENLAEVQLLRSPGQLAP